MNKTIVLAQEIKAKNIPKIKELLNDPEIDLNILLPCEDGRSSLKSILAIAIDCDFKEAIQLIANHPKFDYSRPVAICSQDFDVHKLLEIYAKNYLVKITDKKLEKISFRSRRMVSFSLCFVFEK